MAAGFNGVVAGITDVGDVRPLLVADDGTLQVSGSGGGSSVVTQPDQTLLKDTSYQGGTWNVGLSAGANAIGSVSVSNFPATQPISGTVTAVQATGTNLHVVVDSAPTTAVTGTFWQATQPVSLATQPLPTGASTAAKQPALGTAGTASTDVITVQGIASMTPLQVAGTVTAANASVSTTGSGVPASATMVGGTDGTNLRAVLTDSSGRQVVNINGNVPVTQSGTWTNTVTQATGTNLHTVIDSGTLTANIGTTNGLALDATLTGGTQKAQLVSSGGNAAAVDADGSLQTKGAVAEQSGLSSTGVNSDLVPSFDCNVKGYKSASLQVLSNAGTLTVQGSNDNTSFQTVLIYIGTNTTTSPNMTTTGFVQFSIGFRYLRVRQTAGAGTSTGVLELYTNPLVAPVTSNVAATQSGTWTVGLSAGATVQPGNTANTTPWLVNALLNPTGTLLNTYSIHLTSNATTTPTASTAYISSITISAEVAGTTSTVTIQDKQGTPLKLVNGLTTTALTTTPTTVNFQTPVKMVSGIDIITAGAVAATVDVWINYYQ